MANLFVYGSLLEPAMMKAIAGRVPVSEPALLAGYRRAALRNRWYPGIVPQPLGSVAGLVYFDLDTREFARLDEYEGAEYARHRVVVEVGDDESRVAWCYCLKPAARWKILPSRFDERAVRIRSRKLAVRAARRKRGEGAWQAQAAGNLDRRCPV